MNRLGKALGGIICSVAMLALLGCAGTPNNQSTGERLDSAVVTTKVKAALLDDPEINGFDINVDTFRGNVILHGLVDTPRQVEKAEEIAKGVDGVMGVKNNLSLKSEVPTR